MPQPYLTSSACRRSGHVVIRTAGSKVKECA